MHTNIVTKFEEKQMESGIYSHTCILRFSHTIAYALRMQILESVCKSVCELVFKPEARVKLMVGRSIRIVYKIARPVDLNCRVKF